MSDWTQWVGFALEKLLVMVGTIVVFLILGALFVLLILVVYRIKIRNTGTAPSWPDSITELMAKAQADAQPDPTEAPRDDPPNPAPPDNPEKPD